MKIKEIVFILLLALICNSKLYAQDLDMLPPVSTPHIALKANVLSYAATTFHLAPEFRLAKRATMDLSVNYNPWSFQNDKKMKHVLIQPEGRYWFCEAFNGAFIGMHAHYGRYNMAGIGFTDHMKDHRFQGWLVGGGISYGYHWIVSKHFSVEATIGVGYAYLDYDMYDCGACSPKIKEDHKHYIGPTRAAVSLIYVIK